MPWPSILSVTVGDALWSQAFMFTEHNIPQGSSSPSHTAGECHGFSVENISFNKVSTELNRKWKISINTVSLVVHIPAAVGTIDSAAPKHISRLTASTITAATSPLFGFPMLCSCCRGETPSHCPRHKHPHTLPVGWWHKICESH